jgi:hypothetical protein
MGAGHGSANVGQKRRLTGRLSIRLAFSLEGNGRYVMIVTMPPDWRALTLPHVGAV